MPPALRWLLSACAAGLGLSGLLLFASCNSIVGIDAVSLWDASPGCADSAPSTCAVGTFRCQGNGVQACVSADHWDEPMPCPAMAPFCHGGLCTTTQPSCQTVTPSLCGPSAVPCCESLGVDGGTYDREYSSGEGGAGGDGGGDAATPGAPAAISSFRLDAFEVTVGRFRQYVEYLVAGGAPPTQGSGKHAALAAGRGLVDVATGAYETGWQASSWDRYVPAGPCSRNAWNTSLACEFATWTPSPGANEDRPINCISWYQAYAFCIWDGGFLPSEAEWEYAAAGGAQQREYPWGATPPGTGNQYAIYGQYYPYGTGTCNGVACIAPVGTTTLGAGLWGQLDLAGNVWEWTLDVQAPLPAKPCVDCAALSGAAYRVARGGGFGDVVSHLAATYEFGWLPEEGYFDKGARCAQSP